MSGGPPTLDPSIQELLRQGVVVPAHPLALDEQGHLDLVHQRALTRYYVDAGAGGVAVGVHTTQFAIREHGMYAQVLDIAAEAARTWADRPFMLVAGVTGPTEQAVAEASVARNLGYHLALLNLASLRDRSEDEILHHCEKVGQELPLVGFALLPQVGGFHLSYEFWRRFAALDSVVAIKMAPFDRYRTLDIIRAVVDAGAEKRVTLYTGNDDHIVADLVMPFAVRDVQGRETVVRVRGGLLGHWSVWTRRAVELLERIHALPDGADIPADLLALDARVTDCNAAVYDAHHDFRGCIPGCLEVLRLQGLVRGTWCLDPGETLAPGQAANIQRVRSAHADLTDDEFVQSHLHRWLR